MKMRYYPPGVFIKGTAQYDYFWKYDTTAGLENVDDFDFEALSDEFEDFDGDFGCYCDEVAKEFGYRGIRFWQRIVGNLRSQAMPARASALVHAV